MNAEETEKAIHEAIEFCNEKSGELLERVTQRVSESRKASEEDFEIMVQIGARLIALQNTEEALNMGWKYWEPAHAEMLGFGLRQSRNYMSVYRRAEAIREEIKASPETEFHANVDRLARGVVFGDEKKEDAGKKRVVVPRKPSNMTAIVAAFRDAGCVAVPYHGTIRYGKYEALQPPNLLLWNAGMLRALYVKNPDDAHQRYRDLTDAERSFAEEAGASVAVISDVGQVEAFCQALFDFDDG